MEDNSRSGRKKSFFVIHSKLLINLFPFEAMFSGFEPEILLTSPDLLFKMKYKRSVTHSCSMYFPNTCAIRMSEAIVAASTNKSHLLNRFKSSNKNTCPHGYVRGAQDLAAILKKIWGTRDIGFNAPGLAPANIQGEKGVICYMNIPTFRGQGHIDLWDNNAPIGEAYWNASPIWFWKLF